MTYLASTGLTDAHTPNADFEFGQIKGADKQHVILIAVEGGAIDNVPPGILVVVRDYDVDGVEKEHLERYELGDEYLEYIEGIQEPCQPEPRFFPALVTSFDLDQIIPNSVLKKMPLGLLCTPLDGLFFFMVTHHF